MSTITTKVQTNNQIFSDYDLTKFLLGNNESDIADVTASGADVEMVQGLVISRIGATGKIKPFEATVVDGSEYIVGLALVTKTVADGTTESINFVKSGEVDKSLINFKGAETLETLAGVTGSQQRVKDILANLGLVLISSTALNAVDNS